MVEPTESESKYELDRFCDAMISIHAEMTAIENGSADAKNNLLKNAPHTADMIVSDNWNKPYTREQAAFPAKWLHEFKFWPHVGRVDNVFGDRNPVCSCVGMENYDTRANGIAISKDIVHTSDVRPEFEFMHPLGGKRGLLARVGFVPVVRGNHVGGMWRIFQQIVFGIG